MKMDADKKEEIQEAIKKEIDKATQEAIAKTAEKFGINGQIAFSIRADAEMKKFDN